ncbi:helix-turn-helix domain-containing protein [Bacillus wiedmannii]|uniref:XRE family transcriptional regulator n=1 Tax=Bacillus wiedmannii TaxID=1890302 RepID=A0ABD6TN64_9BACI|nr:helix-turn-helix transcriptional regulator [Bacillus wiedmannii]PEO58305.1 XRE family transcriptional regulator [Bacillus wiedmannii]PGC75955.1 XRE family transcriptional regulator [Bacillus wiedmannii]PHG19448.1 XRE family transcriptional regulator [Bacillus wiedmannii]
MQNEGKIKILIGEGIRKERERNGMTQAELAELSTLHHNYIGQIERGEKAITVIALQKICLAFGMSMGDLFQQLNL